MSTHNLCFGTKIRRKKIEYRSTHANPSFFIYKCGGYGCINFTDTPTCFPGVNNVSALCSHT